MTTSTPSRIEALKRELLMMQLKRTAVPVSPAVTTTSIAAADRARALPLSWAQQRLWFLCQLEPSAALAYHMPAGLRLRGRLDRAALQAALDRVVARHEALRTHIGTDQGAPVQVIAAADQGFALSFQDLRDLPPEQREAALQQACSEQLALPFDLATGPLIRGHLVALADDEHALLFVLHHIICDGWSTNLLVREISALYAQLAQPGAAAADMLPPLSIQYADYAAWQREWLQGAALDRQVAFWKKHLDGAPALLELPTDRPRRPAQGHAGSSVNVHLEPTLTAALRQLARRHGMTPFMVLLAGWGIVLGRMSRQADVVIGTPVANRQRRETEGLIGFFVNTLALRVSLDGAPTVAELLQRVRTSTLAAYDHQDVPFEQVVEAVNPARSMSHSPVFQTLLSLSTAARGDDLRLPGLVLSQMELPHATTHYDLTLGLTDGGERIAGILEYSTELFDEATMTRLVGHFRTLLQAMVGDDTCPVHALALMDADERAQVVVGFNRTEAAYPGDRTLADVFEDAVAATPHAVAVIDGDVSLSYAELDARANRLAHRLLALGVQPDDRVALCAERSAALVIGMLGVIKAGAAYVPMDPACPDERLATLLADCAPKALLTQSSHLARLAMVDAGDVPLIALDGEDAASLAFPATAPRVAALDARHLAYVIYTSGSTGTPKGVMVEHRSVLRLAISESAATLSPGDRVAHCANPAFDAATWEIWATLLNGATLLVIAPPVLLDVARFKQVLQAHAVNVLHLTVGLFNQYAEALGDFYPSLDCLLFGGEKCDAAIVARVMRDNPPRRLVHCYGPTETTTFATTQVVTRDVVEILPIGKPIANTQVHLLDAAMQPVPIGAIGEIHVGGPGVARGYLNQPELTAQRFVPDPFAGGDARLYRTGDLGRWLADGSIDYLGRNDAQVKLRGYRIEPGEIEARLGRCPGVREAAVVLREDAPGDKRLVAYVVREGDAAANGAGPARDERDIQLWPSVGEYFVYDELIYYGLTNDDLRNAKYRAVLRERVKGRVVVDIGTGRDAVLSRLCLELGAARVYAIEIFEKTFLAASQLIARMGLQDRIHVIHGDARHVGLPELADVCVSEIVEAIGGAEGAAVIINSARHLLKPDGLMVPARSVTRFAAVSLPDHLAEQPAFTDVSALYVQRIFDQVGTPFDLRLCIKNFPRELLLSTEGVFEDLDFSAVTCEAYSHDVTLEIVRDGRFDGFLLWMVLDVGEVDGRHETIDILDHAYAWFPVYFPVHDPGLAVRAGDRLVLRCAAELSDNGVNPDYFVEGRLERDGVVLDRFRHASHHHRREAGHGAYYERLFADGGIAREATSNGDMARHLRNQLLRQLPEYMVPSAFVTLPQLPLTPNGKLDRRALPAPEQGAAATRGYVAPEGEMESAIAAIWQDLLGIERVGRQDHFFELGGHSLLAAQLVARLRVTLGRDVALREVFAHPVLQELAQVVAGAHGERTDVIAPADRSRPLPLSWAQQRLWFLDRLDPAASLSYHMPAGLRLHGRLDAAALRVALDRLVARHEVLRTTFVDDAGVPRPVIADPHVGLALDEFDLASLTDEARDGALRRALDHEARRPFDLARGPLVRAALWRLASDEHVLLVTQHHIVSDAWSVGVLVRELGALYDTAARGEQDGLPALSLHYADYAAWQRHWLRGARLQEQVAFWQAQLEDAPALLELPTDHPRPAQQTHAGAGVALVLDADLTAGLKALARRSGTTLFTTLLAGWALLMSRLSGQRDVVIGVPVANRPRAELEGLIGFFVNTLALRIPLQDGASVEALLADVGARALRAFEHQDLPFDQVVEAVNPVRSLSHAPLFQVMLNLNSTPGDSELQLEGLRLGGIEQPLTTTHFDLTLALSDRGETVQGTLEYATSLFEPETAQRIAAQLVTLLRAMVADPAQRADQLPLLDAAERERQRVEFATDATADAGIDPALNRRTIDALFEERVRATPDAVSVVGGGTSLTYDELNRRANRLARRLVALGAGPERHVALCLERNVDKLVAVLAILKSGAAYVPLDPTHPADRLARILADSAPLALLAHRGLLESLPATDVALLVLDDDGCAAQLARESDADLALAADAARLAYVIYTSGSTGQPKGVMVEHGSAVNLWQALALGPLASCAPGTRFALNARLAFDASVKVVLQLLSGHCLVLVPQALRVDGAALVDFLFEQRVDVFDTTPAQLELMFAAGLANRCRAQPKIALIGGEAIPASTWRRLQRTRGLDAWNLYGPTECTVDATMTRVRGGGDAPHIGRPIAGARVHVLEPNGQPAPVGVAGEIHIGGAGVARGYLNRPELTAERFVPDPFGPSRLYRTGDLASWTPDGRLRYIGRNDFQVKLRGYRIELGEIETRLAGCDGVLEAVVAVREDRAGDRRLVGYLRTAGSTPDAASLRARLLADLPEYMVPLAFVVMEAFPLSVNGKVDRRALPAPEAAAAPVTQDIASAPVGDLESRIAALWQQVLGGAPVGRDDDFFELGGHSLLAVQLVARLRSELGAEIALRELFMHPTLADFAARVALARRSAMDEIPPAPRESAPPLSWAQQRLWFLDRLDSAASAAYHMPYGLRLTGRLDEDAMRRALDRVVARHESLRTRFPRDEAVQLIAPPDAGFELAPHDLSALPPEERAAALEHLARDTSLAPFDLASGPLVRGALARVSGDEHVLLIAQHHIVSDGWSVGVFVREVTTLYAAYCEGQADPLPPLSLQYADYAAWQRDWLQGPARQAQVDFWLAQLSGAPALLELPTARPRPAMQSHAGASVSLVLPAELASRVRALGQRHGTTLFMTMLAGWSALLARMSGQDEVVIGTPVANRPRVELEALIGFFVNTLALRVSLQDDPCVADLLAQVRETTLGAFAHPHLPFEQVVEALQPVRSMAHSPVFQAMLVMDNTPSPGDVPLPGLAIAPLAMPHETTQCDLTLALSEAGESVAATLEYARDLFDESAMRSLLERFARVLAAMADDELALVSELPLLDAAERRRLLVDFGGLAAAPASAATLHMAFEEQARLHPGATALAFAAAAAQEEQRITYAELNVQANRLAHRLRSLGVRPDDAVAVCLERGPALIVAMLAVLKSGAALVPVDPALPDARIAFMLDDCRPAAILAQAANAVRLPQESISNGRLLVLDTADEAALQAAAPMHDPDAAVVGLQGHHAAYVIYTSGSTGVPKGVVVTHDNLAAMTASLVAAYEVHPGDRVLQFVAMGFDVCMSEVAMALAAGATLCLADGDALLPGTPLLATLDRLRVTHLSLPSAALAALPADAAMPSVRTLVVGGDVLAPDLARHWSAGRRLFNAYGPTEATVCATQALVNIRDDLDITVPIGRPLPHVRAYVLDAQGNLVPQGVVGELHIGGAGVARGYLGRPELTAQRFVPDPFDARDGARLYRTGDLVRWCPDGQLEFVGRNDAQVKLRGFRIELGEIEARLREMPGVLDAVAMVRTDAGADAIQQRLVAWIAAEGDPAPSAAALRDGLRATLPEYMVPSAVVVLDRLPLNANGKVDRHALPAPEVPEALLAPDGAPQGALENALAAIWSDLLGLPRVGRDGHFFELGGHSLLAVQMAARVHKALGLDVALRELFQHPTIAALAERLAGRQEADDAPAAPSSALVTIRAGGTLAPLFLVHPGEGEVGYARELAQSLSPDLPVHALAASGFQRGEIAANRIEDMARVYVQALRGVQPHGPYRLAGWSVGGTIAWEMAQQLIGADEQVSFLGLIDTSPAYPVAKEDDAPADGGSAAVPFDAVRALLDEVPTHLPQAWLQELHALAQSRDLDAMLAMCQAEELLPAELDGETLRRHLAVRRGIKLAAMHYVRPPLSVRPTLFAADSPQGGSDSAHAWQRELDGGIDIVRIGGSHRSIVAAPHALPLCAALMEALVRTAVEPPSHPETRHRPLITIQGGRAGVAPLFCVPGAGASVTSFASLTQALDSSIPVIGLQPRGLCGVLAPHADVESSARAYVQAIQEVARGGPVHLLGHSFGGWVVTEIARQLVAAGLPVGAVVALDSEAPSAHAGLKRRYSRVGALARLAELFDLNLAVPTGLVEADFVGLAHEAQLELMLRRLVESRLMPARTPIAVLRGIVRVFTTNLNTEYVPATRYDGPVHLLAVEDADAGAAAAAQAGADPFAALLADWRVHAPATMLHPAPGNHVSLLNPPHVQQLARWLQPLLNSKATPT